MNAIRKFQSVGGTGNPVYITDVTYPTELANILGSALNSFGRTTYILSGFDDDGTGTGNFTPGVLWFNGQVYAYDGDSVPAGRYLFAGTRQADQRVTIDGQTYYAYAEYYLFTSTTNVSQSGALVDAAILSPDMIGRLKAPLIPDGGIDNDHLAGGITPDKLDAPPMNMYRPWKLNIQMTGVDFTGHTAVPADVSYVGGYGDHFGTSGTGTWVQTNGVWSLRINIPKQSAEATLMSDFAFMCNGDFTGFPNSAPVAAYSGGVASLRDTSGLTIDLWNVTSALLSLDVLFWGSY